MNFNVDCRLLLDIISKKEEVLENILNICENQKCVLLKPDLTAEEKEFFYALGNEKQKYIDEVQKLDTAFDRVFNRIAPFLDDKSKKEENREIIIGIQKGIANVTAQDTKVRKLEQENTGLIENSYKNIKPKKTIPRNDVLNLYKKNSRDKY